ncbi:MAG TPA: hypothetical protein VFZ44_00815 [Pyrinomonadaceae bacterium]
MARIKPTNIDGLADDYRYRLRSAAVTTVGRSAWSNPAVKVAP